MLLVEIGKKTLSKYSFMDCIKMQKGFCLPTPTFKLGYFLFFPQPPRVYPGHCLIQQESRHFLSGFCELYLPACFLSAVFTLICF